MSKIHKGAAIAFLAAAIVHAGDWSEAVEVRHDTERCVSYRARLNGEFLVVQATHEAGWHTNAMDNQKRAEEKLAGTGRLLIRKSGTEPLIRVMAEGEDPALVQQVVEAVCEAVRRAA